MTDKQSDAPETNTEALQSTEGQETALCANCAEHKAGWQRALADYDNLKKKLDRERARMRTQTKQATVEMLLPVLDNFDQAVRFKPDDLDKSTEGWLAGILHVRKQLEDVLKEIGAQPFGEAGEPFDPNRHDAASESSDEDAPDQSVLRVVRRGWKMNGTIVRPASVVVNNLNN